MFLPDINVWLALAFDSHLHHSAAKNWFNGLPGQVAYFCRMTQQGFLRLATDVKTVGKQAVALQHAWGMYDDFLADPCVAWVEEPRDVETFWREYTRRRSFSPKVWNDAYLAAFARAAVFELVSFDKGFRQYQKLKHSILS